MTPAIECGDLQILAASGTQENIGDVGGPVTVVELQEMKFDHCCLKFYLVSWESIVAVLRLLQTPVIALGVTHHEIKIQARAPILR